MVMTTDETDELFADFPKFTSGRVTYGTLYRIQEWREKHGIAGKETKGMIDACREDGFSAAQAGLDLGLIDYGEASGFVE